jgi:hypothetical protein
MANVPSKVANRLVAGIKRFQPVLLAAKSRDIGESDTVTIVVDMLAEIFGYDKFVEITSEYAIRGTFCDLATKIDGALQSLIEVKAIGLELKEAFVKQAVDYAANQGVDWVVLTNAISWRVYKVTFAKPIGQELVIDIDFCSLNPKNAKDIESLYLFCKEGWIKSVLGEYHREKEALSRFFLGAVVLSDPVLQVIRKELKKASPDVRIDVDKIKAVLTSEVLKREVMEGDKANEARKKVAKAASKALKTKEPQKQADQQPEPAVSSLPEEASGHPISPESEV